MTETKKSLDILGIQPIAEAIRIVTQGAVDGAAAFFGRICLPAAEEFGLFLRDRVAQWRTRNLVNVARKAETVLAQHGGIEGRHVHPRVISGILDQSSWVEEDDIQQMWAGLLAASCTADGRDDSNLVFMSLLGQITTAQVRLLNHVCLTAEKKLSLDGLLYAEDVELSPNQLSEIWNDPDLHRVDRELDHLRMLGLTQGGFAFTTEETVETDRKLKESRLELEQIVKRRAPRAKGDAAPEEPVTQQEIPIEIPPLKARVKPSAIGLHLFVRCQGFQGSPAEFFGLCAKSA